MTRIIIAIVALVIVGGCVTTPQGKLADLEGWTIHKREQTGVGTLARSVSFFPDGHYYINIVYEDTQTGAVQISEGTYTRVSETEVELTSGQGTCADPDPTRIRLQYFDDRVSVLAQDGSVLVDKGKLYQDDDAKTMARLTFEMTDNGQYLFRCGTTTFVIGCLYDKEHVEPMTCPTTTKEASK